MGMEINIDRLMTNLFEMAKIGMNEQGGIDRALGSRADYETRQWLLSYWERNFKIHPVVDPIANMWVKREGSEPLLPIVLGSHHDAVPDGGKYDGAMGVLIATEIMQRIVEDNISLRHPVWIISFTGEEPNPFNLSTLGSKVISGRLKKEDLVNCKNRETGESLKDAIAKLGGDFERLDEARIEKGTIAAFLEPHNELGRHLEAEDLSVGSVSCITGIYREEITVLGEANHAGTTMMQDRKDALLALSEIALEIEEAAIEFENPDVVATMGYVKIIPNEASIIPGQAKAIIDIRTCERNIQDQILEKITEAVEKIEKKRQVIVKRKEILNQPCRKMDKDVIAAINAGIEDIGEPKKQMVSMAGHDASNMELIIKAGMIFVQSVGGKGHCRQEYSKPEDIKKAADALFYALLKLDKELD